MIKPKAILSVTLASIFLLAGCSSEETPRLSGSPTTTPTSVATGSPDAKPSTSPTETETKSKTVKVNGKEVETYAGITPMPDDNVLSPKEQDEWLKSENERIAEEDKNRPVATVTVDSATQSKAESNFASFASAIKANDYDEACSYVYPGEGKTAGDCVAYLKSLGSDYRPSFNFKEANSIELSSTGDIVFQLESAPTEGTAVPRVKFVEKDGKLLLSLPVR